MLHALQIIHNQTVSAYMLHSQLGWLFVFVFGLADIKVGWEDIIAGMLIDWPLTAGVFVIYFLARHRVRDIFHRLLRAWWPLR